MHSLQSTSKSNFNLQVESQTDLKFNWKYFTFLFVLFQFVQCQNDGECIEGQYCHFRPGVPIGLCQTCKDCIGYYYRQKGRNTCSKDGFDCGECLSGYKDDLQSDGSVAQRCTRIEFSWSSALVEPVEAPDELDQIIIILGCLTGFAILGKIL